MISAVLVPQTPDLTQLAESIEGRSVIYLSNPDYVLYLVSEQIPAELSEKIVPAQLNIEYQEPLSGNQHYYSSLQELFDPIRSRILISRRSRLSYLITEYLTPD